MTFRIKVIHSVDPDLLALLNRLLDWKQDEAALRTLGSSVKTTTEKLDAAVKANSGATPPSTPAPTV